MTSFVWRWRSPGRGGRRDDGGPSLLDQEIRNPDRIKIGQPLACDPLL